MARPSRRPGSTTRSGSERRPPGRRSRASRGIPSWSWPWPSLPTADSSPRQAWTTAKVWDTPGGGPARTLTGQAAAVAALAVKPDGKEAAVAAGRSVRIWDLAKSASIEELEGFASEVSSVAWRQDGTDRRRRQVPHDPAMEGGFHARRPDRNPSRCCSGTGVRSGKANARLGRFRRDRPALAATRSQAQAHGFQRCLSGVRGLS